MISANELREKRKYNDEHQFKNEIETIERKLKNATRSNELSVIHHVNGKELSIRVAEHVRSFGYIVSVNPSTDPRDGNLQMITIIW